MNEKADNESNKKSRYREGSWAMGVVDAIRPHVLLVPLLSLFYPVVRFANSPRQALILTPRIKEPWPAYLIRHNDFSMPGIIVAKLKVRSRLAKQ